MNTKLLIIQVAAGGWVRPEESAEVASLEFRPTGAVFPAVTCTAQASFRTASPPGQHGMIANGLYFRDLAKPMFWEQSAGLVQGRRIWSDFRARGGTVGMMFWQQSMGEAVDLLLSPAPIHKHHGGMIQDCYSRPADLYPKLAEKLGPFRLRHYWGPLADEKVNKWIVEATVAVLGDPGWAPDVLLTYLPGLDYALQARGPEAFGDPLVRSEPYLEPLVTAARRRGYEVVVFGDYCIGPVESAALPNLHLRRAGLFSPRAVGKRLYPDFHASRAFAMVDHEVAHVYVRDPDDVGEVAGVLEQLDGVGRILDAEGKRRRRLDHPHAGELVLIAEENRWFAYPWWTDKREAPDFASHVDIHNKPGFDPCELFFGFPPPSVSQDTRKVRGAHGRTGEARRVFYGTTLDFDAPADLLELAAAVERQLHTPT